MILVVAIGVLLVLSLVLPHVAVRGAGLGRSLLPAGFYFVNVQPAAFGASVDASLLAFGFNVAYLGLGLHQFGLVLALTSFWCLYPEDINRWIWRIMVIGGWMLALSAPQVIAGRLLIGEAGVPATLGLAWVPALLSGLALIIYGRRSKDRIDRSWYVTRPELQ
ncbi:MAG: hypothetical protein H0T91_05020 [Propionibacteriaceae bacterium]|nr:hypothetical protein [Propionibacteriaceae bacterium]